MVWCATFHTNTLQTQAILNARLKEELNISLSISVYDVARNEMARKHRKEQEAKRAEEERIRKEKEMDYLAPFLARIGDPPKLTKQQMEEVTQVCVSVKARCSSRAWGRVRQSCLFAKVVYSQRFQY